MESFIYHHLVVVTTMSEENLYQKLQDRGTKKEHDSLMARLYVRKKPEQVRGISNLLKVASDLEDFGINKYCVIGGHGTLVQRIDSNLFAGTEDSIVKWRHSPDIDIVTNDQNILNLIQTYSKTPLLKESKHLSDKNMRKYRADLSGDGKVTLDVYLVDKTPASLSGFPINDSFFENIETKDFYGIPIKVPNPIDLLRNKLSITSKTGTPREKDMVDILNLVSVLKKRKGTETMEEIEKQLNEEQVKTLKEIPRKFTNQYTKEIEVNGLKV